MAHVLVTGASGFLGSHVLRALAAAGHAVTGTYREHRERLPAVAHGAQAVPLDLDSDDSLEAAFRAAWPEVVVHTAAVSDLRECEVDPERAQRRNTAATVKLARLCQVFGARLLFFSTDQVFDGAGGPYGEADLPQPIHTYGRTKLEAEEELLRCLPAATVMRVALVYGSSPSGDRSASEKVVRDFRSGVRPRLFTDELRTPVLADDVADAVLQLLEERNAARIHVAGPEPITRYDFGVAVARAFGFDPGSIDAATLAATESMPRRPRELVLDTKRLRSLVVRPPRDIAAGLAHCAAVAAREAAGRSEGR